ncbi:MAG TPA: GlsB/YeaQ/YmgE family stress response membrane protein [Candidatus Solibacter sp.]|nr:GlsB/YeaQ/YmgE family stress response membrane protein [Candidatus Solibacter sp.]
MSVTLFLGAMPELSALLSARPAGSAHEAQGAFALSAGIGIDINSHFLGWLVMGMLAGWLSGEIVRGKGFGCLGNTLLGLIGAVVGGWLFEQLHITTYGFIGGLAAATVGAVAIVALARALAGSN